MADEIPKLHAELRMLRDELEEMEALYVEVRDLCARQMTRQHELNKRHNAALVVIHRLRAVIEAATPTGGGHKAGFGCWNDLTRVREALEAFDTIQSNRTAESPDA